MTEAGVMKSLKAFSLESGKKDNSMIEKHKEWVLGAIELLRQRKSRPDLPKLCETLQRKHGLAKSEILPVIDQLVQEKTIKKVFFKGQLSYRITKSGSPGQISPLSTSSRITHCIKSIMKQTEDGVSFKDLEHWLISRNPETKLVKTRLEIALNKEIEANIITKLPDNCYVLTESLPTKEKKEETPVLPARVTPPVIKRTSPHEDGQNAEIKRPGRPRRKLSLEGNRYSEDPDYEVPQSFRAKRPERAVCDFCRKPADNRDKKKFLLICKDCNAKAHPSCMNYSEELAAKARNSPWQCIDCKVCFVCNEAGDDNQLLFCDACDKGYHMTCHNPPLNNQPKGKWVCGRCKLEKKSPPASKDTTVTLAENPSNKKETAQPKKEPDLPEQNPIEIDFSVSRRGRKRKLKEDFGDFIGFGIKRRASLNQSGTTNSSLNQSATTVSSLNHSATTVSSLDQSVSDITHNQSHTEGTEGASCLPTPGASPDHHSDTFDYQLKMSESEIPLHINDTATYPNASKWTTEEVVKYFTDLGFTVEAKAFKEQEIDGRSLLLMKRNDVLTGLAIKLGPALKIYQKIYKLQTVGQINSS